MKNNELKTKNIRLVAYRPLELELLTNRENSYGIDKNKINNIYNRVKDYAYLYELCTLWAVYKIDNFNEPLFLIEACGLNKDNKLYINLFNNKSRTINLEEAEVNQAITLIRKYIMDEYDIDSIIILKDDEIYPLINLKNKGEESTTISNIGYKVRLFSAIFCSLAFATTLLLLLFISFLNEEIYWDVPQIVSTLSYIIGIPLEIIFVLILVVLFLFPIIHMLYIFINKKKKSFTLLTILDTVSLLINIFVMCVLFMNM